MSIEKLTGLINSISPMCAEDLDLLPIGCKIVVKKM